MKVHTTIRVSLNFDHVINGVRQEHLAFHVEYNTTARFGQALIVDGKCVYTGYFKKERAQEIEERFKDVLPLDTPSHLPYH